MEVNLKKLESKLKRKAKKGWNGYFGVIHIEEIIKIIRELDI